MVEVFEVAGALFLADELEVAVEALFGFASLGCFEGELVLALGFEADADFDVEFALELAVDFAAVVLFAGLAAAFDAVDFSEVDFAFVLVAGFAAFADEGFAAGLDFDAGFASAFGADFVLDFVEADLVSAVFLAALADLVLDAFVLAGFAAEEGFAALLVELAFWLELDVSFGFELLDLEAAFLALSSEF